MAKDKAGTKKNLKISGEQSKGNSMFYKGNSQS